MPDVVFVVALHLTALMKDRHQVAVLVEHLAAGAQQPPQAVDRVGLGEDAGKDDLHALLDLRDHGVDEVLSRREVAVERRDPEPGPLGDLLHLCIETALAEDLVGGLNQPGSVGTGVSAEDGLLIFILFLSFLNLMFITGILAGVELLGQLQPITFTFSAIGFVVAVVSVMVAAITIFVLIYVNAISKRRQIGILKAIGIKQGIIILFYTFQSLFYSSCGVAIGSVAVFLFLDPYLKANPFSLPFGQLHLSFSTTGIVLSISSILVAGIVAGIIPSWRVSRQSIIAAIWGA